MARYPVTDPTAGVTWKIQKRATMLAKKILQQRSYEERLRLLGLTILQQRRLCDNLIKMNKILTGKVRLGNDSKLQWAILQAINAPVIRHLLCVD